MSDTKDGNDSDDGREVEKAHKLYDDVVRMCQDWDAVDEAKALLIIEYANDALKAFGDTNPDKRVELKKILNKADEIVAPDTLDSFRKKSERAVIRRLYPTRRVMRNTLFLILATLWFLVLGIPLFRYLVASKKPTGESTGNNSSIQERPGPIGVNTSPEQKNTYVPPQPKDNLGDEAKVIADKATVTLDLTTSWVQLDRHQREYERRSLGKLRGVFSGVRKIGENATFEHRVGTSSNFIPEWRHITPHPVSSKEQPERKCHPNTKHAHLLTFDISKEKMHVPFNLEYEIDFWNAHNGEEDDWQSFFVSRPIKQLVMQIKFPKSKPYKRFRFKHTYGINCKTTDFKDFPKPIYKESIDEETKAKVLTWRIDSPQVLWIYGVSWDW